MLESFSKPRIEGHFVGDRMRAWDIDWGHGVARPRDREQLRRHQEERHHEGDIADRRRRPFSLGYPRRDGGEEINAPHPHDQPAARRPASTPSMLDDYPMTA